MATFDHLSNAQEYLQYYNCSITVEFRLTSQKQFLTTSESFHRKGEINPQKKVIP
jgi:hypothetical protein